MKPHKSVAEYKTIHGFPSTIDMQVNHYLKQDFELYGKPMVIRIDSKVDIMVQTMIRCKPTIF